MIDYQLIHKTFKVNEEIELSKESLEQFYNLKRNQDLFYAIEDDMRGIDDSSQDLTTNELFFLFKRLVIEHSNEHVDMTVAAFYLNWFLETNEYVLFCRM